MVLAQPVEARQFAAAAAAPVVELVAAAVVELVAALVVVAALVAAAALVVVVAAVEVLEQVAFVVGLTLPLAVQEQLLVASLASAPSTWLGNSDLAAVAGEVEPWHHP